MVRLDFVGGYMCRCRTIMGKAVGRLVVTEEQIAQLCLGGLSGVNQAGLGLVDRRTFGMFDSLPSEELVTVTGQGILDLNRFVDAETLVLVESITAVVSVPVDMCRKLFVDLDVLCAKLHGVRGFLDLRMGRILRRTGVGTGFIVRIDPQRDHALGIVFQNGEGTAGIDVGVRILILARGIIVFLNHPVLKAVSIRIARSGTGDGGSGGAVLVQLGVAARCAGHRGVLVVKTVADVDEADTLGAIQNLAPLGVNL